MNIFYLMHIGRKPSLSSVQAAIEREKDALDASFRYCESRFEAVQVLGEKMTQSNPSAMDDTFLLVERLTLDLARLTANLNRQPAPDSIADVVQDIATLSNPKLIRAFGELSTTLANWTEFKGKEGALERRLMTLFDDLFIELEAIYRALKRSQFDTPLEAWRRRVPVQISLAIALGLLAVIAISASLFWASMLPKLTTVTLLDNTILKINSKIYAITDKLSGQLDTIDVNGDSLYFSGWAGDPAGGRVAKYVVAFMGNVPIGIDAPAIERPGVAKEISPKLLNSGFRFCGTITDEAAKSNYLLRTYAVYDDGGASELNYNVGLPYRPNLATIVLKPDGNLTVNGKNFLKINKKAGSLDTITSEGLGTVFSGWAGDVLTGQPADYVIVFVDGKPVAIGSPCLNRLDIVQIVNPKLTHAGYQLVSSTLISSTADVRVFALIGSSAIELDYAPSLLCRFIGGM
ncbi:hypothetical protein DSUL_20322 [Desulfovibrionales bacterium]